MQVLAASGKQRIEVLSFSPDGAALLGAGNGHWLDVWRVDAPEPRRFFESGDFHDRVFDARFWDDGRAVIAAHARRGLVVQGIEDGDVAPREVHEVGGNLHAFAVCPSGRRVIGINSFLMYSAGQQTPSYQSWVLGDRELRPAWCQPHATLSTSAVLAVVPDGSRFLTIQPRLSSGQVVVYDSATGVCRDRFSFPYQSAEQLLFGPHGEALVARSGMALVIWPGGSLLQTPAILHNDNRKHFTGVAFHPSGQYLAATSNDTTVKLYDTATWQLAKTFTWDIGRLRSVAFSPDGTRAAVGSDKGQVLVWDVDL